MKNKRRIEILKKIGDNEFSIWPSIDNKKCSIFINKKEGDSKRQISINYGEYGNIYNYLHKNGMPYCTDTDKEIDYFSYNNEYILNLKVSALIENGIIPFNTPIYIRTGNKDDEKIYIYDTEKGIVCVRYTQDDSSTNKNAYYDSVERNFEVLDFCEAQDILRKIGISFEIPKDEILKFVNKRNYKGLKGYINKFLNVMDSYKDIER